MPILWYSGVKEAAIRVLCCLSEDWNMEMLQSQSVDVLLLERWNLSAHSVPVQLMVPWERLRLIPCTALAGGAVSLIQSDRRPACNEPHQGGSVSESVQHSQGFDK